MDSKDENEQPGALDNPGENTAALTDLKDQFDQQQVLISQLKEMLRKGDQTLVTQEKVDKYASTLSKMSARAKKSKLKKEGMAGTSEEQALERHVDLPRNEKVSLLRQQLEENKVKLAQRGKNQKGIEEMVIQLKAQMDDSQNLMSQTPLNLSLVESQLDYNRNTSSEELYNILLNKERKLTDLTSKVQKLEGTVLDLQENVKEKDSVIDARTKAITLMTESLSRKGKNTLDALDETKDQMRKMQENFVQLESDMKARQTKLLEDLKFKNYEITEQQEINFDLSKKIEDLEAEKVKNSETLQQSIEIEKTISDMKKTIEKLQNELEETTNISKTSPEESEEVVKLKKQLDDSNKNMIKVKAEGKSKIKALNKKVEAFKKISDSNAHIVKVEEENLKLQQKIAELEEEKGNLQLKMIESYSKDSSNGEELQELEKKISELETALEEKITNQTQFESENENLKIQIESLNEKIRNLSYLEQVSSEMTSIQFEEQLEKLEADKNEILKIKDGLALENEKLNENIENLSKEKLELQIKFDQYVQENMELADKLEKLSAEKVSSAESIEIVDNLTQQERLELEVYQKNLDEVSGKMKISEENLENAPELNESVNQLNEETSDLLQKIELFTVERREVMEKMEILTNENNDLNIKLKQVENNRDVLSETYEQLQSEKEVLDSRIEGFEKENRQLKNRIEFGNPKGDNGKIKELEDKISENLEEISNYQSIIEDNKNELINSAGQINVLHEKLNQRDEEIEKYKIEVADLKTLTDDLNTCVQTLEKESEKTGLVEEEMEKQLESLKSSLKENLEQIEEYEKELDENSNTISDLNTELKNLGNKILETEHLLERKNQELVEKDATVENYQREIFAKDEMFQKLRNELKEKYLTLQKQTDTNSDSLEDIKKPLQDRIIELTSKNAAQLEKMKKIAANLKKKTQTCQELEERLKAGEEKWEVERSEKDGRIRELVDETEKSKERLVLLQRDLDERCNLYKSAVDELEELKNVSHNLPVEIKSDISLQQELSDSISQETLLTKSDTDTSFSKIQELEMLLETQENEIQNYKERINHLEETLGNVDQRRLSLERKTNELGVQLEEKSNSFEEISQCENILEKKLSVLVEKNEEIEKKLHDLIEENRLLLSENRQVNEDNTKLKEKVAVGQDRINELTPLESVLENLEQEILDLKKQIANLENNVKFLENENSRLSENTENDILRLESDWQSQFDDMVKEKNEAVINCEKLQERLAALSESEAALIEKMEEYKAKLVESERLVLEFEEVLKNVDENHRLEVEKLKFDLAEKLSEIEGYKIEVRFVRQLSSEKIDLENRVGVLQTELERSKSILDEMEERNNLKQIDLQNKLEVLEKELEISNSALKEMGERNNFEKIDLQNKIQVLENKLETSKNNLKEIGETNNFEKIVLLNKLEALQKDFEMNKIALKEAEERNDFEKIDLRNKLDVLEKDLEMSNNALKKLKERNNSNSERQEEVKKSPLQSVATFLWPEQQEDPFSFVTSQTTDQPPQTPQGNTKDELLKKIKTLEFMLCSVENERNDVLLQCTTLTDEVMRLLYEKEEVRRSQENLEGLETLQGHILNQSDLVDSAENRKKMQDLTYQPCKDFKQLESETIIEDACIKKEAYLCHPEEPLSTSDGIEGDIIPECDLVESRESIKELERIQFEKTKEYVPSTTPVDEEPHGKKSAYVCCPGDVKTDNVGGNDDDGWGWGPEEVKLEEEHMQGSDANQISTLNCYIEKLQNKIRVLELENENHTKEYKELQVKSGKLIKKLKEMKVKNDRLQRVKKQDDADSFSLENAIQEELKSQIEELEKTIKETSADLAREKAEKKSIQKRVEVLTSANERMVEMKEKQDIEMLSWQRKSEELKFKLDQFDWGDNSSGSPKKIAERSQSQEKPGLENVEELQRTIEELNETIRDLNVDNEELQALLEDQRALRMSSEKDKSVQPLPENYKTETEYMEVVEEKVSLQNQLGVVTEEKKSLQDKFNELIQKNDENLERLKQLDQNKVRLDQAVAEKEIIINNLNITIETIRRENIELSLLSEEYLKLKETFGEISSTVEELKAHNSELEFTLQQKNEDGDREAKQLLESILEEKLLLESALIEKENQMSFFGEEKERILNELLGKNREIDNMKCSVDEQVVILQKELEDQKIIYSSLLDEHDRLKKTLLVKEDEHRSLVQQMNEKDTEFAFQLVSNNERLNEEWQIRVDQRGNDVAESWKLHLESRETEFALIESNLRKEINELEERCNVLVNENNELRKNVNIEIRNEVDRYTGLQNQITERQNYINELTATLTEKQINLDRLQEIISQKEIEINRLGNEIENRDKKIKEISISENRLQEFKRNLETIVSQLEEKLGMTLEKGNMIDEFEKVKVDQNTEIIEQLNIELENNRVKILSIEKELSEKDKVIENNQATLEDYIRKLNDIQRILEHSTLQKDEVIASLTYQLEQIQNLKENETENVQNLHQSLSQNVREISNLNARLSETNTEVERLTRELTHQTGLVIEKEDEISRWKNYVEEANKSYSASLERITAEDGEVLSERSREIDALNEQLKSFQRRLEENESESLVLRHEFHNQRQTVEELTKQIQEYDSLNAEMCNRVANYDEMQKSLVEQNVLIEEENKQMTELRGIIHDQVVKIEELKSKLFEKSNDYDSIIAEMEIRRNDEAETGPSLAEVTRDDATAASGDEPTVSATHAELDLALYMLHQRDVRCEELTVELTQLLEERDTLQLRLSNALREKEDIRRKLGEEDTTVDEKAEGTPSRGAVPKRKVGDILLASAGAEIASEALEYTPKASDRLADKISELKSIRYNKDKTLVDAQELRQLQQLSVMHQHRDAASRLPPEAAARLLDASYTLSRDVQSPSKVLLNWLWGNSTPKVNEL